MNDGNFENGNIEVKLIRSKPRGLSERERGLLFSRIEQSIRAVAVSPLSRLFVFRYVERPRLRFAFAGIVVAVLVFSVSGGAIASADSSRPGDALFGLDRALERVHLAISSPERRTLLELKFAEERVEEAEEAVRTLLALADDISVVRTDAPIVPSSPAIAPANAETISMTSAVTAPAPDAPLAPSASAMNGSVPPVPDNVSIATHVSTASTTPEDMNEATEAIAIARGHLTTTREKLASGGNATAVALVDGMIARLDNFAAMHIASSSIRAHVASSGNTLAVTIRAEDGDEDAKFVLKERTSGTSSTSRITLKDDESHAKLSVNGEDIDLSLRTKNSSDDDDDRDDDGDDDDDEGEDDDEDEDDNKGRGKKFRDRIKDHFKRVEICHRSGRDGDRMHRIRVSRSSLRAHLAHGDTEGPCVRDDTATSTPDRIAPNITDIVASATTTSAIVSWETSELSDSRVWFGTTSPVQIGSGALTVASSTLTKEHELSIDELTASTTYRYIVVSRDAAGNTATSSERAFTTASMPPPPPPPPDIVAPVMTGITSTSTTATTTVIAWMTDEGAKGSVWFGTTTPLAIASTTPAVSQNILSISHALFIDGLSASTTHYYIVTSSDALGNTSTSSEHLFMTSPE